MALRGLVAYGRMIKFGHSIFALPFAFSGAALAAVEYEISPEPEQVLWIAVAMVGARSAAMGFNRLVDRKMDAANPRTAKRELPQGGISAGAVKAFVVVFSAVFIFAAYQLNPLCTMLSPIALGIVFFLFLHEAIYLGDATLSRLGIGPRACGGVDCGHGATGSENFALGGRGVDVGRGL